VLASVLVAVVSFTSGCITDPKNSKGDPMALSDVSGTEPGAGADPVFTRNMGANVKLEWLKLPGGTYGWVPCSAEIVYIPQAVVDAMDGETRLAFFRALALVGSTWADAGSGAADFGLTRRKYEDVVKFTGNATLKVDQTVRKIAPAVPDPN
jgi:hypothetical protein